MCMSQFKRAIPILLPAKESKLHLVQDKLHWSEYQSTAFGASIPQHLYIVSGDEEIKEGDWFYCKVNPNGIQQCIRFSTNKALVFDKGGNSFYTSECKKIIATTDSKLNEKFDLQAYRTGTGYKPTIVANIPKPSPEFIQKYIEMYNAGTPITEMLVEYEKRSKKINNCKSCNGTGLFYLPGDCWASKCTSCHSELSIEKRIIMRDENLELKVDKNNCITIKKVKDNYNREELSKLICDCLGYFCHRHDIIINGNELNEWIEKHL